MHALRAIIASFLALVAVAGIMEITLRLVEQNSYNSIITDPDSGLTIYRPNTSFTHSEGCYDTPIEINNLGLHGPQVSVAKGKNVFRIEVVGNSFVEDLQVPISQMFTTLLQDQLNSQQNRQYTYEVIPIGYSGNGTLLDILYYERFGEPLQPDLVINLTNEIELQKVAHNTLASPQFDASGNLILTLPKPATTQDSLALHAKNLFRASQLAVNLYNRYLILRSNIDDDLNHTASSPSEVLQSDDAPLWAIEDRLMPAFPALVAHDGAHFLLASWTTSLASTSTAETLPIHFASMAHTEHFSYLDLVPPIAQREKVEGKSAVWSCDIHWDADGNRFAADALFEYLQAHPTLIGLK